jgi:hypothetical protein
MNDDSSQQNSRGGCLTGTTGGWWLVQGKDSLQTSNVNGLSCALCLVVDSDHGCGFRGVFLLWSSWAGALGHPSAGSMLSGWPVGIKKMISPKRPGSPEVYFSCTTALYLHLYLGQILRAKSFHPNLPGGSASPRE